MAKGEHEPSDLVQKGLPCESCGSHDAVASYTDGHRFCYSCQTFFPADGQELGQPSTTRKPASEEVVQALASATPRLIKSRGISQETCERNDYLVRQNSRGVYEQLAVYKDDRGTPLWIKVRTVDEDGKKDFYTIPSHDTTDDLYGFHRFSPGGKKLTIVEGELDRLTVDQCYSGKWPVVSVPKGAAHAAKAIAKNLEKINTFEQVIFGFDMDEPGQDAAIACAKLLPPGKAFIVHWTGGKDANEMLLKGLSEQITKDIWQARPYRPDGIIDARDLTEICLEPVVWGIPWPWRQLTEFTYGRRNAELYVIGAGFGIGKSDFLAEIIASTISGKTKEGTEYEPEGCAVFAYEAGAATTKKQIAGKLGGRRFHIPQDDSPMSWTREELVATMQDMDQRMWGNGGKLYINDSKGCADWDTVKDRARYLAHAEGIKHFFVDPISAMVEEDNGDADERKFLDHMVREAAKLALELDAKVYLSSHLTRPKDGPSHEEGGQVRGNQFRGSNAIGMFTDFVLGEERNTQADSDAERCVATVRIVKDRYTGNSTGKTMSLVYDVLTGSLDPAKPVFLGEDE